MLYKPILSWNDNSTCHDIIVFQDAHHATKLAKDLTFDKSVDKESRITITDIITEYWDCYIGTVSILTVHHHYDLS